MRSALAALALAALATNASAQMRPEVNGTRGAVTADHPLAAAAGAEVLRRGGNAVDAAITMAAVLAVVRPHMNGLGGDAFMLIREAGSDRVHALNGSGRSPRGATPEVYRRRGLTEMPEYGLLTVTVPGAVRAWDDALRRFGSISLADALAPAIRYARDGFPVSEKLTSDVAASRELIAQDAALADLFLPDGEPPEAGTLLRQRDLAATLEAVARDGPDAFYLGDFGQRLARLMEREDGLLRIEDLADHSSSWQQPIWARYRGFRVAAFPPNSQGIALLLQMNVADLFDLRSLAHNSAGYVHSLVEIQRMAFRERDRYVSDPVFTDVPIDRLLSREFTRTLAEELEQRARGNAGAGGGEGRRQGTGDTVVTLAVDSAGNAVALIQSLFHAFGSGRMVPETGVILHNRGALFSLDTTNVNVIAPAKRTYHTLAPNLALRADGSLFMVFATPGGDGQTQTNMQVFNDIVLYGMSPQRAVEAPRWRIAGPRLTLEPGFDPAVIAQLRGWGHDIRLMDALSADMGGAQVILVSRDGVLRTGADPRREAYSIAY